MTWGIEGNVIERFDAAGVPPNNVSFARDTYVFNFPDPPSEAVDAFRHYYGPTMSAFEAAEKNGRAGDLKNELDALVREPEHQREQGCHFNPGDLPARDGFHRLASLRPLDEGPLGVILRR